MKKKPVILPPVDTSVVRASPLYAREMKKGMDPRTYYTPVIDNFKQYAIGRYFWFILDFSTWRHIAGGGAVAEMTPLSESDFVNTDNAVLQPYTHPDDLSSVMAFTNFWLNYFPSLPQEKRRYTHANLYFRIQNPSKDYYWVMVQYSDGVLDEFDHWMFGLAVVTDISHIKKVGVPMMSILDSTDESSQQFFYTGQENLKSKRVTAALTKREKEIVQYLAKGYSSKQIAGELGISIKTVDNHRQNMLHKTNTKTSAELLSHCIHLGYLFG